MSSFCGKNICETYQSILNVGTTDNDVIPSTPNSHIIITDGLGNCSSLSIGQVNQGVVITGSLSASGQLTSSNLAYPTSDGTVNQVIKTCGNGTLAFDSVCDLIPQGNIAIGSTTTYDKLSSVTIDSKGRVVNTTTNNNIINEVNFVDPQLIFSCSTYFHFTDFTLSIPASAKAVILNASHTKTGEEPTYIKVRKDNTSCSYNLSYFNSTDTTSMVGNDQGTFPISNNSLQITLTGDSGSVTNASVCVVGYMI